MAPCETARTLGWRPTCGVKRAAVGVDVSPRVSPENRARALEMLAAGQSVTQVAADCGVTPRTVRSWASRAAGAAHEAATQETARPRASKRVAAGATSDAEAATRPGTPARLHTLVVAQHVDPPTVSLAQVLPFEALAWENFERLCLRLAVARGTVEYSADHAAGDAEHGRRSARDARLYGVRGQAQKGIDLYVRLPDADDTSTGADERRYLTVQSRRIASLTAAKLRKAVSDFLAGTWAGVSRVFVYAVALPAIRTELADEIVTQTARLKQAGIDFEVWDGEGLSLLLKHDPILVHDFFGRAWVDLFCGAQTAPHLRTRLDAAQVGVLRERLAGFYATLFAATDSGTAALRSAAGPNLALRERFVPPDVVIGPPLVSGTAPSTSALNGQGGEQVPGRDGPQPAEWASHAHAGRYPRSASAQQWRRPAGSGLDAGSGNHDGAAAGISRAGIDTWLASDQCLLLVGEPGAGKSTVLRYVLLDLLSDAPSLERCAERFGDRLPVWLPFHFLTRRKALFTDEAASLAATLRAWFEQQDAGQLWTLVSQALDDERLLLIVDGLDEWVEEGAGLLALKSLEVFISQRAIPALVSTRPFGLTRLQLGSQWRRADLASLSEAQQRKLAHLWFAAEHGRGLPGSPGGAGHAAAHQRRVVDDFFSELRQVPELRRLAGVPLFLLALIGLRLAGISLPSRRFDVYEQVVDQLLRDHPALRAAASASANPGSRPERLRPDDVRYVLAHVAHAHQARGEFGPVEEHAVRRDVITALKDPGYCAMDEQRAAATAGGFVEVAEGELGVLVRQGPRSVGFLHRVLLEQLAAEHLSRLQPDQLRDVLVEYAADPRWQEVLLAALWRITRPTEMTSLIEALAALADGEDPAGLAARELLARAVFGGFHMPAPFARRHAEAILDVVEVHPHLPHRERLLTAAVAGLGDPAVGALLRTRLGRWAIARPLSPGALYALGGVCPDEALPMPVWPRLVATLAGADPKAGYEAAHALAARYGGTDPAGQVRDALVGALGRAPSADRAALILLSLALGWGTDGRVRDLVAAARDQRASALRLTALAAALGLLGDGAQAGVLDGAPHNESASVSGEEVEWLFDQLGFERMTGDQHRLLAPVLVAAGRLDDALAERARERCLEILTASGPVTGDRYVAWEVLLTGHAAHADVVAYVCGLLTSVDAGLLLFGTDLLIRAYPDHPQVASAIEEYLQRTPYLMDHELGPLAASDQGPVIRGKLMKSLASSSTPHWASRALSERWSQDQEVTGALRSMLAGEPVRASCIANVAVRLLGPRAAIDRLLEILAAVTGRGARARADIVAYELVQAFDALEVTDAALAERIAGACLDALEAPDLRFAADAEAAVIEAMASTETVKARIPALLERAHPPLRALIAGYGNDPTVLATLLEAVDAVHPTQPPAVRRHLCLLLRDAVGDGSTVREITARWHLEPDDLGRSAASAAFHTHLRRDRDDGRASQQEWQEALDKLRELAVSRGMGQRGEDLYSRRVAAWLGALLLDEISLIADLSDPFDARPLRLPLGDALTGLDMTALGALAEYWPQVRDVFGDDPLDRFGDDRLGTASARAGHGAAWERLALIADRQPLLSAELEADVAAHPQLLEHDAVISWYASTHRGQPHLLDVLIGRVDADSTNARSLVSMLLAEPSALGIEAADVRARLRERLTREGARPSVYQSGALEALAEGFPDDEFVHACWQAVCDLQRRYGRAGMHPRTYLPLAYAAVPASDLRTQMAKDAARLHLGEDGYFDHQFTRAVVQRLRRDEQARTHMQEAVRDPRLSDGEAAQLAGFLAAAQPLSQETAENLAERLVAHLARAARQPTLEFTPLGGESVAVALLSVLDATVSE